MSTYRYGIYPARFPYGGGSNLDLAQVHGVSVTPGGQRDTVIVGGKIDPSAHLLVSAAPRVSLMTHDLATVLAAVSPTAGLAIDSAWKVQHQARIDGGVFATTNHSLLSGNKGFMSIGGMSARQGSACECNLNFWALSDGTNKPIVGATPDSVVITPAYGSKFWFGPVFYNSSQLLGVIGSRVDFGIGYQAFLQDGEVYPTCGAIQSRVPSITLTLVNHLVLDSIANIFNSALAGSLIVYYLKAATGGRSSSSDNVSVTAATGTWAIDGTSVSENADGEVEVTVQPTGTIATASNVASPVTVI